MIDINPIQLILCISLGIILAYGIIEAIKQNFEDILAYLRIALAAFILSLPFRVSQGIIPLSPRSNRYATTKQIEECQSGHLSKQDQSTCASDTPVQQDETINSDTPHQKFVQQDETINSEATGITTQDKYGRSLHKDQRKLDSSCSHTRLMDDSDAKFRNNSTSVDELYRRNQQSDSMTRSAFSTSNSTSSVSDDAESRNYHNSNPRVTTDQTSQPDEHFMLTRTMQITILAYACYLSSTFFIPDRLRDYEPFQSGIFTKLLQSILSIREVRFVCIWILTMSAYIIATFPCAGLVSRVHFYFLQHKKLAVLIRLVTFSLSFSLLLFVVVVKLADELPLASRFVTQAISSALKDAGYSETQLLALRSSLMVNASAYAWKWIQSVDHQIDNTTRVHLDPVIQSLHIVADSDPSSIISSATQLDLELLFADNKTALWCSKQAFKPIPSNPTNSKIPKKHGTHVWRNMSMHDSMDKFQLANPETRSFFDSSTIKEDINKPNNDQQTNSMTSEYLLDQPISQAMIWKLITPAQLLYLTYTVMGRRTIMISDQCVWVFDDRITDGKALERTNDTQKTSNHPLFNHQIMDTYLPRLSKYWRKHSIPSATNEHKYTSTRSTRSNHATELRPMATFHKSNLNGSYALKTQVKRLHNDIGKSVNSAIEKYHNNTSADLSTGLASLNITIDVTTVWSIVQQAYDEMEFLKDRFDLEEGIHASFAIFTRVLVLVLSILSSAWTLITSYGARFIVFLPLFLHFSTSDRSPIEQLISSLPFSRQFADTLCSAVHSQLTESILLPPRIGILHGFLTATLFILFRVPLPFLAGVAAATTPLFSQSYSWLILLPWPVMLLRIGYWNPAVMCILWLLFRFFYLDKHLNNIYFRVVQRDLGMPTTNVDELMLDSSDTAISVAFGCYFLGFSGVILGPIVMVGISGVSRVLKQLRST